MLQFQKIFEHFTRPEDLTSGKQVSNLCFGVLLTMYRLRMTMSMMRQKKAMSPQVVVHKPVKEVKHKSKGSLRRHASARRD